jgi:hypothetical protein
MFCATCWHVVGWISKEKALAEDERHTEKHPDHKTVVASSRLPIPDKNAFRKYPPTTGPEIDEDLIDQLG